MRNSIPLFMALLFWAGASLAAEPDITATTDVDADAALMRDIESGQAQLDDPLEPFNRAMFSFNCNLDALLLRPVAMGYRDITPQVVRTHIAHVSDNLYEPLNTINALLQGDVTQGMQSLWRFVINTTIGIGGLNDIATEAGLPKRTEDFGQTLAVWGVDAGPYLVLPIFGPSNFRDAGGRIGDWFLDPVNYAVDTTTSIEIDVAQGIVRREQLIEPIDAINASSLDPYATYRSIYEQRREAQIANHYNIQQAENSGETVAAPKQEAATPKSSTPADMTSADMDLSYHADAPPPPFI